MRQTLAIIKPDAVLKGQTGRIIDMIEDMGFQIEQLFKTTLSLEETQTFYEEHADQPFFDDLTTFMSSGSAVFIVLRFPASPDNVISHFRVNLGDTDPKDALQGTIRATFATSKSRNAVHGSDSETSAERELQLLEFFQMDRA